MENCPCGLQNTYLACCGKFHSQQAFPQTPEALMRSRYSAFVKNRLDYIEATMKGAALKRYRASGGSKSEGLPWCGLEVLQAYLNPQNSDIGFVEFKAYYKLPDGIGTLHELSEFHREKGHWYYVDGSWR